MNATNRAVNRVILFIIGVVLMGAGSAVVMAVVWPVAGDVWNTWASTAVKWMTSAHEASRIGEATTVSWFALALLAFLMLILVITAIVVARLGGGRSSSVIREEAGEGAQGAVTIGQGFASDAITHSLASRDEVLSSKVTARRMGGVDIVHVSVTPRQNRSPVDIATTVTELVDNLATLTGRQTPTVVSIHSGIRAKLAADQSRVS